MVKKFHPAVWLYLWICLAIIGQALSHIYLIALAVILLILTLQVDSVRLFTLLKRTRWIFVSLLIIFAYSTPGRLVWSELGYFSPTVEGLEGGGRQVLYILNILFSLIILMGWLNYHKLVEGLVKLMTPFAMIGLNVERLAIRLSLTIYFAERAMVTKQSDLYQVIGQLSDPATLNDQPIKLVNTPFQLMDWALFIITSVLVLIKFL